MKFHTIITLSTAALFFQQIFALAPQEADQGVSMVEPVISGENSVWTAPETQAMDDDMKEPVTLEADLIKNLGWSKTESDTLTSFINAIDQMGAMIGAGQNLDQATMDMLAAFQSDARKLIAEAGYEYRQGADDHQVLTRISGYEQAGGLQGVIKSLVSKLTGLLKKIKKSAKGHNLLSGAAKKVINLVKSLGRFLKNKLP